VATHKVAAHLPCTPAPKKPTNSVCEPHREWIETQLRLKRNAQSIYQDLVEIHGFPHKYSAVQRFVRKLKVRDPKQFDVLEFMPAEEAQVDYGQGALTLHPTSDKYRKPYLFVMTMAYSGKAFRKVMWKTSQQIWAELHQEAFRAFGGCVRHIVLDNLKEGVLKPDLYEPKLNPVFGAMLTHCGVVADPCRVGDQFVLHEIGEGLEEVALMLCDLKRSSLERIDHSRQTQASQSLFQLKQRHCHGNSRFSDLGLLARDAVPERLVFGDGTDVGTALRFRLTS
jgi:transposase